MLCVALLLIYLNTICATPDNSTRIEVEELFNEIEQDYSRLKTLFESVLEKGWETGGAETTTTEKETDESNRRFSESTDCVCVPAYQCNDDGYLNKDGYLLQERISGEAPPRLCANPIDICCKEPKEKPIYESVCGLSGQTGSNSVRTEQDTSLFGELPWTVVILENSEKYTCVGSLIHPQVVLTAAHCINETLQYTVRAGEWNVRSTDEPLPHQSQYVETIIKHPQFNSNNLHYDAVLLILSRPFRLADNVNIICIAEYTHSAGRIFYDRCAASGWGLDTVTGKYKKVMKRIEFSLVQHSQCQEHFRTTTHLGKWFELHRSFVCAAGQNNFDVCTGDGGGPLVCPVPGPPHRYHLVGITSWGVGCAEKTPSVFTRVSEIKHWIDGWFEILKYSKDYEYESTKIVY